MLTASWQGLTNSCAAVVEECFDPRQQYDAVLRLLEVFSEHLSISAEQIATQQAHAEPPMVERAPKVIEERHGEDLSLDQVARTVNASTFHFCKMFKRATGMTFTEYLSVVRVAKAKKLLANPQARISEVAFEASVAPLTHFNRMFRRITGPVYPFTVLLRILGAQLMVLI